MRFAGAGLSEFYGNIPNYTKVGQVGIEGRGLERNAVHAAEAQVAGMGLRSAAEVQAAKYAAEATKAEGQAAGQAAIADGIGSMASGIAGGFASMPTGGGGGGIDLPQFNYW